MFSKTIYFLGGRRVFREFLRCEYSEENILFWMACEELKKVSRFSLQFGKRGIGTKKVFTNIGTYRGMPWAFNMSRLRYLTKETGHLWPYYIHLYDSFHQKSAKLGTVTTLGLNNKGRE
jgi:hypothetical protein